MLMTDQKWGEGKLQKGAIREHVGRQDMRRRGLKGGETTGGGTVQIMSCQLRQRQNCITS